MIQKVSSQIPKFLFSESKKVVIYGRKRCLYCQNAKELFDEMKVQYTYHDTTDQMKKELFEKHKWSTLPMIFIDDKFKGGYTDVKKLIDEGKLTFIKKPNL